MQLQGRNLLFGIITVDVLQLEVELYLLGFEHTFSYSGPAPVLSPRQPAVDAFDEPTKAAVREMQAQHNLPPTGVVMGPQNRKAQNDARFRPRPGQL